MGQSRLYVWADGAPAGGPENATIAALSPVTGVPFWSKTWANTTLVTAAGFLSNGVYFAGDQNGNLRAYRVTDGKLLWHGVTPGHSGVAASLWVEGKFLYVGIGLNRTPNAVAVYRVP